MSDRSWLEFCAWLHDSDRDPFAFELDTLEGWRTAGKRERPKRRAAPPKLSGGGGNAPRYLTLAEAGELVRASPETVRYWIWQGRLEAFKPGRTVLVREGDLLTLVERRETTRIRAEALRRPR